MKHIGLLLIALLLSSTAYAWKIAVVISAKDVAVERDGRTLAAGPGFDLEPGDLVVTPSHARAVLYEEGSRMTIAGGSRVRIEARGTDEPITVSLEKGATRAVIQKVTAPKYNYKVPTAVAGVRGTEFFLGADEGRSNICVLEGEVAATMANGDLIDVPQGLGVATEPATRPRFAPTALEAVSAWRAQTSEDDAVAPVFPGAYETMTPEHAWGSLKSSNRLDVNDCRNSTTGSECRRLHLYARLLWELPENYFLQVTPLFQWGANDPLVVMDVDPLSARENDFQVRPYELIVQKSLGPSRFLEAGVKPLEWGQPLFMGARRFSAEPASQPFAEYRRGRLTLLGGFAVGDRRPLDGLPGFSVARVGYDLPWGSSALGLVSFNDHAGTRFYSPQFSWSDRFENTTLSFAGVYESGKRELAVGDENLSESVVDLAAEENFSFGGVWRLKARALRATAKYRAPLLDSYALGVANLVPIADLDQRRALLAYSVALGETYRLELGAESLESKSSSSGGYVASETDAWIALAHARGFLRWTSYKLHTTVDDTTGWMLLGSVGL